MGLLASLTGLTGDGQHDFGSPNKTLNDLVWTITTKPAPFVNVDTNNPAKVTRVGYLAYGTSTDGSGDPDTFVIGGFKYIEFDREDWNLPNVETSAFQFLQWHLLPGMTLDVDVYVF